MKKTAFIFLTIVAASCSEPKTETPAPIIIKAPAASEPVAAPEQKTESYSYTDTAGIFTGTLIIETFWGPPSYGEDTLNDMKEICSILMLEKNIDIPADRSNEFNMAVVGLDRLQLATGIKTKKFVNKKVTAKGQLFGAHTGHHHTAVLLDVKEIKE